jgi:hypothetical protein
MFPLLYLSSAKDNRVTEYRVPVRVANRGSATKSARGLERLLDLCRAIRQLLGNVIMGLDGLEPNSYDSVGWTGSFVRAIVPRNVSPPHTVHAVVTIGEFNSALVNILQITYLH